MALQKVGTSALAVMKEIDKEKRVRVKELKALDEETYTKDLEKIIVKDFFPDLPKMQAQTEYLDALKQNNVEKLREIQMKYASKTGTEPTPDLYNTPATFETPDKRLPTPSTSSEQPCTSKTDKDPCHNPEEKPKELNMSLDAYLSRHTSEDNASFTEILRESQQKHRDKHAWLFEQEQAKLQEETQRLALPTIEQQAIDMPKSNNLDTWKYENRNHLMYVPDGVEKSAIEKIVEKKKPREIVHSNTRFEAGSLSLLNKSQMSNPSAESFLAKQGKIGVDGKEILAGQSPSVGGYGFVATPSPVPGVDASPLMTWGEIEGTPFRLDGGGTPMMPGNAPGFKIPDVPHRDRLGLELSEKASKLHRAKKKRAMDTVTSRLQSPSPRFGSVRSSDRLSNLSPAAQRLASTKLGIRTSTDKALRQSYTPSPMRRSTPSSRRQTPTPKSSYRTPSKAGQSPLVRAAKSDDVTSLTDNLLNIPIKRKKSSAADFF